MYSTWTLSHKLIGCKVYQRTKHYLHKVTRYAYLMWLYILISVLKLFRKNKKIALNHTFSVRNTPPIIGNTLTSISCRTYSNFRKYVYTLKVLHMFLIDLNLVSYQRRSESHRSFYLTPYILLGEKIQFFLMNLFCSIFLEANIHLFEKSMIRANPSSYQNHSKQKLLILSFFHFLFHCYFFNWFCRYTSSRKQYLISFYWYLEMMTK